MSTEHEYKFVISLDFLKEFTESWLIEACDHYRHILQGYLARTEDVGVRVRQVYVPCYATPSKWFLTVKCQANRQIEVETELDERDGIDLWKMCSGQVTKTRYIFIDGKFSYELDIFKDVLNEIYFIMVEVELPEGAPPPEVLPDFMQKYLVYKVPLTDNRFSNKKLGDVEYTKKLYTAVRNSEG